MTIFSSPRLQREDMGAHEFSTSLGDVIGATAREAVHEMPSVQLHDIAELQTAKGERDDLGSAIARVQGGEDPADVMATPEQPQRIPMTEAKAKVKDAGLDRALTLPDGQDMSSPALDIMMERARGRQERAATIARGPSGIIPTALSVGTSFAVGAIDPVNVAAAFIPVVGEARYAKLLADAAGTLPATVGERLAARAGIGAASGAVGMAAIEPIAALAKTQEGQDYTFGHALRSVIFGAVLGAGLHTGGGAIADVMRTRGGRPLYPFDIGEPLEFHTPWDELKLPPAGAPRAPQEAGALGAPPVSQTPPSAPGAHPEAENAAGEAPPQAPSHAETTVTVNGETRTLKTEWDPAEIAAAQAEMEQRPPSPAVAVIDDLPPRAREDAMRGAVAALVQGEPVRVGEMIEAGAKADPRIAESVDAGHVQAVTGAAEFSEAGKAVFTDIRRQLTDQGIGPDIADANAAVFAARYEARAARLEGAGGTAEDLYRAEGIEIRRNSVEDTLDGRVYAQRRGRDELAGQLDLGGTGPISDAELAQRRADQALKPKVAQRPMDEGLFGDTAQQTDLVDQARQKGQRELFQPPTVPTFYSAVERAIGNVKMEKASPDQWLATIRNTPGVKAEELEWLGVADWLKDQDGPVTRQQLQDYVRANAIEVKEVARGDVEPRVAERLKGLFEEGDAARAEAWELTDQFAKALKDAGLKAEIYPVRENMTEWKRPEMQAKLEQAGLKPLYDKIQAAWDRENAVRIEMRKIPDSPPPGKFFSYVLPGAGESYRELLLTLPAARGEKAAGNAAADYAKSLREKYGERYITQAARDELREYNRLLGDQHDIAARGKYQSGHWDEPNILAHVRFNDRTIDGKKTLFIEEVQSDWHQAGKRKGYKQGEQDLAPLVAADTQARAARNERADAIWREATDGKASGLQEALDHGFDRDTITAVNRRRNEDPEYQRLTEEADRAARAVEEARHQNATGVPDAPFKTTWPELSLKRMIRYAAENGYDKIAWTPGEVQAERYDLSKHVDRLGYTKRSDGKYNLTAEKGGNPVLSEDGITAERIADLVGKDIAEKIEKGEGKVYDTYNGSVTAELTGLDLKVGGEGMKGFYDKILPATVSKLTKKFGGKVENAELAGAGTRMRDRFDGPEPTDGQIEALRRLVEAPPTQRNFVSPITGQRQMFQLNRVAVSQPLDDLLHAMEIGGNSFREAMDQHGTAELAEIFGGRMAPEHEHRHLHVNVGEDRNGRDVFEVRDSNTGAILDEFATRGEAERLIERETKGSKGTPVHTLDITPELRKAAVEQGFPLFQGGERGRITLADNKAIIDLFKSADRSTLMHEAGHLWLDELARDAARANAPEGIRADMDTVLKWLGADRPEAITVEQHEKWAAGFEQYLASGEAPTPALKSAFQKFKDWFTAIYKSITAIGEPIPDEIRAVFDRMLAMPEQAAEKAEPANVVNMPARRGPAARDPETFSLLEFIASRGGLRNDDPLIGDVRGSIGRSNRAIPGFGSLIRQPRELSTAAKMGGKRAPMTLDQAREAAVEAGYLHDNGMITGGQAETTINDLLELIDRELRGNKVYKAGREREREIDPGEEARHRESYETALRDEMTAGGLDPASVPDKIFARVVEIMRFEGERDPVTAYERAVMEGTHDGAEAGEHQPVADHIPGWDVPDVAGAAPPAGGAVAGGGQRGAGAAARQPGGPDRAAYDRDTWSALADTPRDFNEPDVVAASKRAEELPEPESAQPSKRLAAAQKAEAEAQAVYDAQADYLPPDVRGFVEQELRRIDQDALDTTEVLRRGAACLANGVVTEVA